MHPLICTIGPFSVYSYGFMLVAAFLICSLLIKQEARKQNVDPESIFNFLFLIFVFGIVGARIFYVVQNIGYYSKNPLEIVMLQHGGLSWFGGLILGTITGVLYLKKKNFPILKILDLVIPFVALGQALGRIGCLLNGCCYGRVSEFGIYFETHQAILIPTQVYSSLLLIIIFIILRIMQKKKLPAGKILFTYLLLYSLKRFFIEFWRADNPVIFFGLTFFQLLSIVVFCIALSKLALIRKTGHKL